MGKKRGEVAYAEPLPGGVFVEECVVDASGLGERPRCGEVSGGLSGLLGVDV